MEVNTLSIIIYVLVPILTAVLGGWIGAYFGNKYREDKESHEKEIVRNIAIKALNILKSYTGKSYREAEGEFNKSMSIAEKRTVVVALQQKLLNARELKLDRIEKFNSLLELGEKYKHVNQYA